MSADLDVGHQRQQLDKHVEFSANIASLRVTLLVGEYAEMGEQLKESSVL